MREILFRGKPKNLKAYGWVYGQLLYHSEEMSKIYSDEIDSPVGVIPDTVGQFTGLTDKNGKKIFEGDIVRVCLDPEICIGDVIWDSEIASYNIPFSNGKCVLPLDIFIAKNKVGDKVWIEVIGNIYDNPELLEGD